MRMIAIKDLCQLPEAAFVGEVARGIKHLYRHGMRLFSEADTIHERAPRAHKIIEAVASEEYAKILILVDALRISRAEGDVRARQLGYFNDHLAKGIYVQYCWTRPASFKEVREFVERERPEFYRDGPNDYDWVFRNEILRRREQEMYVDYVETEEDHAWWTPERVSPVEGIPRLPPMRPAIRRLVEALETVGMLQEPALGEVRRYWQDVSIEDATQWQDIREHNQHTLGILMDKGLVRDQSFCERVVNRWPFPLYTLELSLVKNHPRDLPTAWVEW